MLNKKANKYLRWFFKLMKAKAKIKRNPIELVEKIKPKIHIINCLLYFL